ncbi:MAG: DUF58 domain-containing protein [Myxococcota bacterium]
MTRLLVLLRRARDVFPLTPLGVLALVAAGVALQHLAFAQLDLVVLVVGYGLVGLVALAALGALGFALVLRPRWRRAEAEARREGPLALETGFATETGFSLPFFRWVPLLETRWTWVEPAAVTEAVPRLGARRERVTFARRGEHAGIVRVARVGDVFGLARVAWRRASDRPVSVAPHAGALGALPVLRSLAGGDAIPHPMGIDEGDRMELRRYAPGDPARFIHWKIFGRTRKLVVRMPERALSPARRNAAYLVAGEGDEASAGAARVALRSGVLGDDWAFGADGTPGALTDLASAEAAVIRSGGEAAREEGGRALRAFLAEVERRGPATALIFVPARPGPWTERLGALLRERRGRARVVLAVDGLDAGASGSFLRRLLVPARSSGGVPLEALEAVRAALGATGTPLLVLDRTTGRVLGDTALRRSARRAEAA